MTRFRVLPALALAAGLSLTAGVLAQPPNLIPAQPKVVRAQPKLIQPQPVAPVAAEVPVLPKSAAAFVSLRLSDVIDHPDLKPALEQSKKTPEAFEGVTELFGVSPHEIDRVTLFWPAIGNHGPGEPVVVITTRQAYNEARLLKTLRAEPVFNEDHGGRGGFGPAGHGHDHDHGFAPKSATKGSKPVANPDPPPPPVKNPEDDGCTAPIAAGLPAEPLFYQVRGGPFELLFLVDDRTLVFLAGGPRSHFNMMALFAQLLQKKQTGPLTDAIAAAGNHTLSGGVSLVPLFREFERHMPPELAPYAALVAARTGTVTGDLGKSAKMTLRLSFDDAASAKRAAPVLDEGLKTLAAKATEHAAELKDSKRPGEAAMAPLLQAAATGMKNAVVKADGSSVTATAEIDAGPAAAKAVADLLQSFSSRKKFAQRTNNLKQIGLALHNYHDTRGHLPQNVYGPKGELLLSWRVELLPYIEEGNLYKQFKMDEAWDGPNNKKLIESMPKVYEVVGRDAPKGQTFFQAFLTPDPAKPRPKGAPPQGFGRSWLVEGGKQRVSLAQIPDGTSNTIGVVEAREGVIWSKPEDLPFGEKLPALGEERADVFMALMLDGSVRAISTKIKPETLRILIDGQDGMITPDDAFDDRPRRPGGNPAPAGGSPPGGGGAGGPGAPAPVAEELRLIETRLSQARRGAEQDRLAAAAEEENLKFAQVAFQQGVVKKETVDLAEARVAAARTRAKESELRVQEIESQLRRAKGADDPPRPAEKK